MRGQKRERILRVLLTEPKPLSKNELSRRTNCTRQWIILFLRALQKKKIVKGTTVLNRKELLKYWLSVHKKPTILKEYMVREPLALLRKTKLAYALTTYQAENLAQHYLFPTRTDLYVREDDLEQWHQLMTRNGLYGKGNVRLIIAEDHVMYGKRRIKGLSIVSLPQLIIDLFAEGGPAEEAAEMLLKKQQHVC
ncbi:hypothetical protein HY642_01890 [Candidatus Woesearchaeota archaeon]|nr:hypothetical protein [Candidatus Woesearchaeota archaeon]